MGNHTIRRSEEMKPEVEVVYNSKGQGALRDAYHLLARFFAEAHRVEAEEAGKAE